MPRVHLPAAEIAAMEPTPKTHFLNDNAKRMNKSLGDLCGMTGLGFHIIEVQPGFETTEHHKHYHEDECVYVLSGRATAYLGDAASEIGPGDFLGYAAGGEAHSIVNTGDELLRCIVVGQRLAHDVGEYPRQNKRINRNVGMPWELVDLDDVTVVGGSAGKK